MQFNGLSQPYTRGQQLPELLKQRILILDGAMGTMIQQYKLSEGDYRGLPGNTRFADHPGDLKGNNELLVLTQPRKSSARFMSNIWMLALTLLKPIPLVQHPLRKTITKCLA